MANKEKPRSKSWRIAIRAQFQTIEKGIFVNNNSPVTSAQENVVSARRNFIVGAAAAMGLTLAAPITSEHKEFKQVSDTEILHNHVVSLTDDMAMMRAWYEQVEPLLRAMFPGMTEKVHDAFVNGSISARALARSAGHTQRDFSDFNWAPSPRGDRGADPFDQGGVA